MLQSQVIHWGDDSLEWGGSGGEIFPSLISPKCHTVFERQLDVTVRVRRDQNVSAFQMGENSIEGSQEEAGLDVLIR